MDNKEKLVILRITEKDKEKLKVKAKKVGVSLSEFLRLSALNSTVKDLQMKKKLKEEG